MNFGLHYGNTYSPRMSPDDFKAALREVAPLLYRLQGCISRTLNRGLMDILENEVRQFMVGHLATGHPVIGIDISDAGHGSLGFHMRLDDRYSDLLEQLPAGFDPLDGYEPEPDPAALRQVQILSGTWRPVAPLNIPDEVHPDGWDDDPLAD